MTIAQAFAKHLDSTLGIAHLDEDLFIGVAPSSNEVPDALWWLIDNGGGIVAKNQTGETRKNYQLLVYCRSRNPRQLAEDLFSLEEQLNCSQCVQLEGFDTVDVEATSFPIDEDIDSEDRKVGLLQVTITTYKEC